MADLQLPDEVLERLIEAGGLDLLTRRAGSTLLECRDISDPLEIRTDEGASPRVVGYASVFDYAYPVAGGPERGGFTEIIDKRAFKRTLARKPDVSLLFEHAGLPLARSTSGTLSLEADGNGLVIDTPGGLDVENNHQARALVSAMTRRDVDEMSFGFSVPKGGSRWNGDYTERTVTEVNLHRGDVSLVSTGANPATVSRVRRSEERVPVMSREYVEAYRLSTSR